MMSDDYYGYTLFIQDGNLIVQCPRCHGVSTLGLPGLEYSGLRLGELLAYVAGHRSVCHSCSAVAS